MRKDYKENNKNLIQRPKSKTGSSNGNDIKYTNNDENKV